MQLTPDNLQKQNFTLLEKVEHSEFNAFSHRQTWNSTVLKLLYFLFVFSFSLLTIGLLLKSSHPIIQNILFACLGVLMAFLIVPFHEFIHYLMYKYFGANNVKITPYWNKGYVLTKADQFVVSKKEMKWIAFAPFIFISTVLIILLFFLDDSWQIVLCFILLFHATLCHADFLIMDYFLNSESDIFMYYDAHDDATYIYKPAK